MILDVVIAQQRHSFIEMFEHVQKLSSIIARTSMFRVLEHIKKEYTSVGVCVCAIIPAVVQSTFGNSPQARLHAFLYTAKERRKSTVLWCKPCDRILVIKYIQL